MSFDVFRLPVVQRRKIAVGFTLRPKQFVEFSMDCLSITTLCPLNAKNAASTTNASG